MNEDELTPPTALYDPRDVASDSETQGSAAPSEAQLFYGVPSDLMADIARFLYTQPYGQVNHLITAMNECPQFEA